MKRRVLAITFAVLAVTALTLTALTVGPRVVRAQTPAPVAAPASDNIHGKQIVAYYTEWGIYGKNYVVKNIVTSGTAGKVTVVDYAFSNISPSYQCAIADAWADYQKPFAADLTVNGQADTWVQPLAGNFNQLKELKALYPNLKIMISIGGWTESTNFSGAAEPANRAAFVQSCIDMYIKGNLPGATPGVAAGIFDGIDIDWEYPNLPGNGNPHGPQDIPNFTGLLAEFHSQLDTLGKQTGKHYLLTADTPAGQDKYGFLQLAAASRSVDWFNLLTYDMHGPWDANGPTGFNAPLFASPDDPSAPPANTYSVDRAVTDYIAAGVSPHKIVIGVPFYGHGWTNVPNVNHGLYQSSPNIQPAPATFATGTEDFKVLETLPGFTGYRDPVTQSYWIYDGTTFWSVDDPQTMLLKMAYVREQGLGGAMFWSLDSDDASGSLASALYNGLSH